MKLVSIEIGHIEELAICIPEGLIPVNVLNRHFNHDWPTGLFEMIKSGKLERFRQWFTNEKALLKQLSKNDIIPFDDAAYCPLYRHPSKIWGIGLNYASHASDLSEKVPTKAPASFMKPDTAIIGHKEPIYIPVQSNKTTAEAELGIIIGQKSKNIKPEKWMDAIAGFTTIIDMTAEDILRQNPRYLTMSKSFDTFFSFGPCMVTPDEIVDLHTIEVSTILNNVVIARNTISNMTFPPDFLVSFHSEVMTLNPGDIISTGTPGAVHINNGDEVECAITGFMSLKNTVIDLKNQK